jgi:hypothetical protein
MDWKLAGTNDQRNRLNHSLCVFRRALGGEVRGRQIDSLDRLGSAAAASDVANSSFALMDRGDHGASARAVVAPDAEARC